MANPLTHGLNNPHCWGKATNIYCILFDHLQTASCCPPKI